MKGSASFHTVVKASKITSSIVCVLQLQNLSYEGLQARMSKLDPEMEKEIEDLRIRYQAKRQPILDAIDAKKKRMQNFWGWAKQLLGCSIIANN